MDPNTPRRCTHADHLRDADGCVVRLCGTYRAVPTLKKMPRPGQPREEAKLGQVLISLEGSAAAYDPLALDDAPATVALGDGPRPAEEIAAFDGKRVEVEGRLVLRPAANISGAPLAAHLAPQAVLQSPSVPSLAD
ncbi:MAG: hypothetical protein JSR42_04345 [Proteobacteria bacterium]|nr:hypothetical protein [Pseudomonadota bacterium]MBS0553497.1 hypothetical protein [Pseudomonadota bacterium]